MLSGAGVFLFLWHSAFAGAVWAEGAFCICKGLSAFAGAVWVEGHSAFAGDGLGCKGLDWGTFLGDVCQVCQRFSRSGTLIKCNQLVHSEL